MKISVIPKWRPFLEVDQPRLLIYLATFILIGSTLVGTMNSGDGTQFALTKSLAEDQSIFIGKYYRYVFNTDFAIGRNGQMVSDREPGQSIVAVPFYYLGRMLSPLLKRPYDNTRPNLTDSSKLESFTYLAVTVIVALGLARAYDLMRDLGASAWSASATCLLIAFGTLMWKYSSSFVRQPAVGVFLLLIVLHLLRYRRDRRGADLLAFGVLGGLAISFDLMIAVPLAIVGICFVAVERPPLRNLLRVAGSLTPFMLMFVIYNHAAFGELVTTPHFHEARFDYMKDLGLSFHTRLADGLRLNLVSFGPIPEKVLRWTEANQRIFNEQGVYWAIRNQYKGIFVQSPFLLLSVIGWIVSWKQIRAGIIYPVAIVLPWLIMMSAYSFFWSPNTYDGRYLLPLVPTLGLGLIFFIDRAAKDRSSSLSVTAIAALGLTAIISTYFAWESVVTNFAPNLSGDHRYQPGELFDPIVTFSSARHALIETFPNVYNLPVLLAVSLALYGLERSAPSIANHGRAMLNARKPKASVEAGTQYRRPAGARLSSLGFPVAIAAAIIASLVFIALRSDSPRQSSQAAPVTLGQPATSLDVAARNTRRVADLQQIQAALSAYASLNGSYPSTGGKAQTLCLFEQLDAGCKLAGVLPVVPIDPLGKNDGYWYSSDGKGFILIARWEGADPPPEGLLCSATDLGAAAARAGEQICLRGPPAN